MRTILNNTPLTGATYNSYEQISEYYLNGISVASLTFSTDEFESDEDVSEEDKDFYYSEMTKEKQAYENQ